jgi:group I intron endonuclease
MEKLFDSVKHVTKNSGIYYLKIQETNYIGSSVSLKNRLQQHANMLIKGKHENRRMQNVFNKYREDKCYYSILETFENITQENLLQKEKYWIDLLNPVLNNKMDPATQNNCASNSKVVYQFDTQGRKINSYASTREAERKTNVKASSIIQNCNRHLKSAGGYLWSYEKDAKLSYDLERSKWKWKAVEMHDTITNEKLVFDNIAKAVRYLNLDKTKFDSACASISSICKGKGKLLQKRYSFCYRGSGFKTL